MASVVFDALAAQWAGLLAGTPCYAGLHYNFPSTDDPLSSEVTGPSYTRASMSWSYTTSDRILVNSQEMSWVNLDQVTLIGVGVWDDPVAGDLLLFAQLDTPYVVKDRSSYQVPAGTLWMKI